MRPVIVVEHHEDAVVPAGGPLVVVPREAPHFAPDPSKVFLPELPSARTSPRSWKRHADTSGEDRVAPEAASPAAESSCATPTALPEESPVDRKRARNDAETTTTSTSPVHPEIVP